ncbi:MAG: helix-turn-helix domain-containing protein [Phycisphaeraceae bacterium]|nr:helix-turn-helix domain-containing protein [Phycisphaeraceae bacterium]
MKLFYTLEEAAQKLGKSTDEVMAMARSGQLQEFRDKEKIMFKVESIDLLSGGDDDLHLDDIKLSDSAAGGSSMNLGDDLPKGGSVAGGTGGGRSDASGIGLMDSGAGMAPKAPKPASAFDSMGSVAGSSVRPGQGENMNIETVGSGSGILDLDSESDDTTLGAEHLDQAFQSDDAPEPLPNASGLFERGDVESGGNLVSAGATAGITPMPLGVYAESYDGAWSGVGVAGMVAALVGLVAMGLVVLLSLGGGTAQLARTVSEGWMFWTGGFALVTAVLMAIGFFVGRATE